MRAPWLLVVVVGCGTPSRHLSTRVVEDPMVLPQKMLSLGLGAQVGQNPRPELAWDALASINYGLSDRLELHDVMSLRWAILDDAPVPADWTRRPDRLSLAVRGGLIGLGVSSTEGLMLYPIASAEVRKHLGGQSLVSARATWQAGWVENPFGWSNTYSTTLRPNSARNSSLELGVEVLRQLGDHVALGLGVSAHQLQACTFPGCAWASRGGELRLGPQIRPRRWLTLGLQVFAGGRYRAAGRPVLSPDERLYLYTQSVAWLGTSAMVAFQW